MSRRPVRVALAVALATVVLSRPALAHAGSLSGEVGTDSVPFWAVALTGGGVVGVSFLFSTLITDHEGIRMVNGAGVTLPAPATTRAALAWVLRGMGVVVLGVVVASGLFGPADARSNFAILVVWAGWWAGYTMSVYLAGNSWPALNPWYAPATAARRVADRAGVERRPFPWTDLGTWPAAVALVGMVYLEVVTPVASDPRLLSVVILGYTAVVLAASALYGPVTYFERVDPIVNAFRWYGRMAPVQRTDDGLRLRLPTTALTETDSLSGPDETPFVVALLWATTFDGLVSTPLWSTAVESLVGAAPAAVRYPAALLLYLVAMLAGFAVFLVAYRRAARAARSTAGSYVAAGDVGRWLLPALVPIAAGYHVAHFLGYFLTLSPSLLAVLTSPFSAPVDPQVAVLPGWFTTVQLGFVVLGHMLAVWVAHALSFELFPGTFKPIRSQYPFIVVMVFYTMVSMWVIAQPYAAPPYV